MRIEDIAAHEMDFAIVLEEVFGPRAEEFSEDLRSLLREMWERGVEMGAYATREKAVVPEEMVVPRRLEIDRSARKVEEMAETKVKLVEAAELVALRLEHVIDPERLRRLEGDDLTKGVHDFLTQTARIHKRLTDALRETDRFRILDT